MPGVFTPCLGGGVAAAMAKMKQNGRTRMFLMGGSSNARIARHEAWGCEAWTLRQYTRNRLFRARKNVDNVFPRVVQTAKRSETPGVVSACGSVKPTDLMRHRCRALRCAEFSSKNAMQRFLRHLILPALAACCAYAQSGPASPDFFESKVRPILANNCYGCHTDSKMGGLRVDGRDDLLKGGARGPALVPGDADKSLLISAVRQTDPKLKMPAGGKLKPEEIETLVAWVKGGAVWPATAPPTAAATPAGAAYVISPERKKFWSFLPLQNPKPPAVKDSRWALTDIDRFILANLENQGLKPVRMASRR